MTPYNTGKVKVGRSYIPPFHDSGSVSGPHRMHRKDRIVVLGALVCFVLGMLFAFA